MASTADGLRGLRRASLRQQCGSVAFPDARRRRRAAGDAARASPRSLGRLVGCAASASRRAERRAGKRDVSELTEYLSEEIFGDGGKKEVEIVVDILTNPNSGYVDRKLANKFRSFQLPDLSVDEHIAPVVAFLASVGATRQQMRRIVLAYPPVLTYDPETHLRPLVRYLEDLGVPDVLATLVSRPSLLGLKADANLSKIVDWLEANDYSSEDIIDYLSKSL